MYKRLVLLGTKTNHGGCVITASSNWKTGGGKVALDGDIATCPIKGHGGQCAIIATGRTKDRKTGRRVALTGDKTTCGAILLDGGGTARVLDVGSELSTPDGYDGGGA